MRISEALTGYWLDKRMNFSATTVPGYERTFRRLVEFMGDPDIEKVTSSDIRRFLAWLPERYNLSRRTVSDAWIPLSSFWSWAEKELGVPHILRGRVKRPKFQQRRIEPLTEDQVRRLLAAVDTYEYELPSGKKVVARRDTALRDRAIILVLLDSGLRASELCDLRVSDHDAEHGRLHVRHGKGDKERYVVIGQRAQKALWRYMATRPDTRPADPLFAVRRGGPMHRDALKHLLTRIGRKAGVPNCHPHRFRHAFAIGFLRNGGSIAVLRELLGHEDVTMCLHYARAAEIDISTAAKHSISDGWRL